MCGIVGGVTKKDIVPILMEGLRRLEYRGYDSAGIAILDNSNHLESSKVVGKVRELQDLLDKKPIFGKIGIAHTRWATHGVPSLANAHPHIVGNRVAIVHNGIIENYEDLKKYYTTEIATPYTLKSDTDSEIIAVIIYDKLKEGLDFLDAVRQAILELEGAYAICVLDTQNPKYIIGARSGPPLIVGRGELGHFFASDVLALQDVASEYIYLEDGDIVELTDSSIHIFDKNLELIERKAKISILHQDANDKAGYDHFMLKEIFEQPLAFYKTLEKSISQHDILETAFGDEAAKIFDQITHVQIVACGTSFYAGLVGRLWIESLAKIPCSVEIASEFRYRERAKEDGKGLLILISQSGETADTLAALRAVQPNEFQLNEFLSTLAICNVPNSSLVREAKLVYMTEAGPEIGVCSTKAFTTQLLALFLLSLALGKRKARQPHSENDVADYIKKLLKMPDLLSDTLALSEEIKNLSKLFKDKAHTLFLGRGLKYPIALEGALKLKEISYIHAEAYPAGELKHGPLALVDKDMPVVVLAPKNNLLDKLKSNIQEVRARGGELIIFAAKSANIEPNAKEHIHVIQIPEVESNLAPFVYTLPLQLLAYHVAVLKGNDVDQPRNLAKSVTVE